MEAILLNGGGIDTLAAILKLRGIIPDVVLHSLYISAEQNNNVAAKAAAQEIADIECDSHRIMTFEGLTYLDQERQAQRLPYRTTLYHLMASTKARHLGLSAVVSGIDNQFSENYGKMFSSLLAEEGKAPYAVLLYAPVRTLSRQERIDLVKHHPIVKDTVSCEQSEKCGACNKCLERIAAGIDDA